LDEDYQYTNQSSTPHPREYVPKHLPTKITNQDGSCTIYQFNDPYKINVTPQDIIGQENYNKENHLTKRELTRDSIKETIELINKETKTYNRKITIDQQELNTKEIEPRDSDSDEESQPYPQDLNFDNKNWQLAATHYYTDTQGNKIQLFAQYQKHNNQPTHNNNPQQPTQNHSHPYLK